MSEGFCKKFGHLTNFLQGCKSGLVKKSETLVYARSTWVYKYNYAWSGSLCLKSGAGSQ